MTRGVLADFFNSFRISRCAAPDDDVSLIRLYSLSDNDRDFVLSKWRPSPTDRAPCRFRSWCRHSESAQSLVGEIDRLANSIASHIIEPAPSLRAGFVPRRSIA